MKSMLKQTLLYGAALYLAASSLYTQSTWTKTYGGTSDDLCYSVLQTADGGYAGTGLTYSYGGQAQVYLFRTDSLGTLLWSRYYGGNRDDAGQSVQQTDDGGFIVSGWTKSYGPGTPDNANVYLLKTNSTGDTLWTKVYGGNGEDCGYAVQVDTDGGYIIAGSTASSGAGEYDVYLIKTDAAGDTLWTRTFGGSARELAHSVDCTPEGGYILAGNTFSFGPGVPDSSNTYLIRTNGSGDTLWTRVFGSARNDGFWCARPVVSGGFIAVGWSAQDSSNEMYLVRVGADGDTLWTRHIGGADLDDGLGIEPTDDGGYVIAGFTSSFGTGGVDVYLVRTDSLGLVQWYHTFGGPQWDFGHSIQLTADGGFIIGGYTYSFGTGTPTCCNAYLIKTDGSGNVGVEGPWQDTEPSKDYDVLRVWPNPYRERANITYSAASRGLIELRIYDIQGRLVNIAQEGIKEPGTYTLEWDGRGSTGHPLSAGIYFIRLSCGDRHINSKIVKLR